MKSAARILFWVFLFFASTSTSRALEADAPRWLAVPIDAAHDPVEIRLPRNFSHKSHWPVVVLLHGYSANGKLQDLYFGVSRNTLADKFILALPNGTLNESHRRFWNATPACCAPAGSSIDDVSFLTNLILTLEQSFSADPKRVTLFGHSNGAFMAHRMACDKNNLIAGIAALDGVGPIDIVGHCPKESPVAVLQIHGSADATVLYNGGFINGIAYPGSFTTASEWAAYNNCDPESTAVPDAMDLVSWAQLPGKDTSRRTWKNCEAPVELLTINGGKHIPLFSLNGEFTSYVLEFLLAQHK